MLSMFRGIIRIPLIMITQQSYGTKHALKREDLIGAWDIYSLQVTYFDRRKKFETLIHLLWSLVRCQDISVAWFCSSLFYHLVSSLVYFYFII
jgi:hypothetical protein